MLSTVFKLPYNKYTRPKIVTTKDCLLAIAICIFINTYIDTLKDCCQWKTEKHLKTDEPIDEYQIMLTNMEALRELEQLGHCMCVTLVLLYFFTPTAVCICFTISLPSSSHSLLA